MNGQKGWFQGKFVSFRFHVASANLTMIPSFKVPSFPRIRIAPAEGKELNSQSSNQIVFSPLMQDDWLSTEKKAESLKFRQDFREYMDGANIWNKDWLGNYFRDRPKPPKWTEEEDKILSLLIRAGYKLQDSWRCILQYGFVNRSLVGTSQQWYKIRRSKLSQPDPSTESSLAKPELVMEAKRRCHQLMENHLRTGVPTLGKHPLEEVEQNDTNSEVIRETKRRKTDNLIPTIPAKEQDSGVARSVSEEATGEGSPSHY